MEFYEKLRWLSGLYHDPDETDNDYIGARERLQDFEDSLQDYQKKFTLPDFVDKYFANLTS